MGSDLWLSVHEGYHQKLRRLLDFPACHEHSLTAIGAEGFRE
jgi:hypothetical protein